MSKWVATGGVYTFTIEEQEGKFDITVDHYGGKDFFWWDTLAGAKKFIRREYDGLDISRFKKVGEEPQ